LDFQSPCNLISAAGILHLKACEAPPRRKECPEYSEELIPHKCPEYSEELIPHTSKTCFKALTKEEWVIIFNCPLSLKENNGVLFSTFHKDLKKSFTADTVTKRFSFVLKQLL
jgi:hypothetical protein